jgi:hypothetical protein
VGNVTEVWGRLATALGGSGEAVGSALGMPGAATALLLLVGSLAALTVWIELSVRAALLYLLGALVPLALAGLFWRRLASWAVRLGEVILAVALSQVIITAALVVGTSVVQQAMRPGQDPAANVGGLLAGVGLLLLASLGLPITLGVVPIAVDAAVHAGVGRQVLGAAGRHVDGVRSALSQPASASLQHRLATAPGRAVRAGVSGAGVTVRPPAADARSVSRMGRGGAAPDQAVSKGSASVEGDGGQDGSDPPAHPMGRLRSPVHGLRRRHRGSDGE